MQFVSLPLVVVVILATAYFVRHPEPDQRARFCKLTAFVWMMVSGAAFAAFAAGEALSDPGGWEGVALVAAWVVPAVALAALAWRRPRLAGPTFVALTAALVALGVWYAFDRHGWNSFEDRNGPIRTIASFDVLVTMSFLAWRRPAFGGALMLVAALLPVLLAVGGRGAALVAAGSPAVIGGVLFLLSAMYQRRVPPPTAGAASEARRPKAA